jgi:hypothetical protein
MYFCCWIIFLVRVNVTVRTGLTIISSWVYDGAKSSSVSAVLAGLELVVVIDWGWLPNVGEDTDEPFEL